MTPQELNFAVVIILGIVSVTSLVVLAYGEKKQDSRITAALEPMQSVAETLAFRMDEVMALHGELLKPIFEVTSAAETLVDSDDDFLVQSLPAPVIAAIRKILEEAKEMTDGKPPTAPTEAPPTVRSVSVSDHD